MSNLSGSEHGLVVGADIGGTSTRVAVADTSGRVLARADGGPGSPVGVGLDRSAAEIRAVVDRALSIVAADGAAAEVRAYVLGMAGGSQAKDNPAFAAAITPDRIAASPWLVSDLAVAFCSATSAEEGYVLIGGTGAVAGRVVGPDVVAWSDGMGWLLGDIGSGFWLGREAVRRTLLALQSGAALSPLNRAVIAAAGSADYTTLISRCYAERPTALGRFAPLVSAHVADSPEAPAIVAEAASALAATLLALAVEPGLPIVLGGSLLAGPTPIAAGVRERLAELSNPVLPAGPGALGACWLGLRSIGVASREVHDRLVSRR